MRLPRFLLPFFFLAVFTNCNNEIDINAEWQEVMVCYGVLDPADTAHYIRVEKGFLGYGNAEEMAGVFDSIHYDPADMEVRLEQWRDGLLQQTFWLQPDTHRLREPGLFANPRQILYKGVFTVVQDGSRYRLIVVNHRSGKQCEAETPIVQHASVISPVAQSLPLSDGPAVLLKVLSPQHGRRVQPTLRFHYTERFVFDTLQVSYDYVDWPLEEKITQGTAGGEQLIYALNGNVFQNYLSATIRVNPLVERIAGRIEFVLRSGADDLHTYILVQQAMQASTSDLAPFSNIEGGHGVFSSTATKLHGNYQLSPNAIAELRFDPVTADLNFIR